jgi:hypothetical protein
MKIFSISLVISELKGMEIIGRNVGMWALGTKYQNYSNIK